MLAFGRTLIYVVEIEIEISELGIPLIGDMVMHTEWL